VAPIRIAHIVNVESTVYIMLANQLRSIRRAGYDVSVIVSPGGEADAVRALGVAYFPVPIARELAPLADLVALWRLYRLLRRERFTIVHTHNPKPGLLGQLAARLAGTPVVVNTVHGYYLHDRMSPLWRRVYLATERLAARCSDAILSQNEEDIRTALRERICPPAKIAHLGNGIDLSRFEPGRLAPGEVERARAAHGIPPGARVVGFVGRLAARRKGFADFLRAGEIVAAREPDVHFVVIGQTDRGKADAVEPEVVAASGIGPRCHLLGKRPNAELPALYALMDVLVLPSLFEGIPRVVMEAAAMGVPAVVSDVKGNREAVEHGRNGLLVPYGDPAALAAAVGEILGDPARAARMGEEARRVASERFDERRVFDTILAAYARLLRSKGLTPPPGAPAPAPRVPAASGPGAPAGR
jgi:glycosyltransferase involved in cell wall biosynthesis